MKTVNNQIVRALLLAAGKGTRLRPLTNYLPKCLMPISNRPLLEYWLRTLLELGIDRVLVNTHFHADQIEQFLAREQFSSWVSTTHETELLGTAGTLRENADFFRGQTTLLVHADNWCQCDFPAFVNYHLYKRPDHCLITMMTFNTETPQSCGIVETNEDGVVTAFHEKVSYPCGRRANAAVYLLHPSMIEWLENHPQFSDFSSEILPRFVGRIATWHNAEIHRDIGTISALRAAQQDPQFEKTWPKEDVWQRDYHASSGFITIMKYL